MADNYENGVWRTVRGRRIFIRDGEDLASAMKRSGKFKDTTKQGEVPTKSTLNTMTEKNSDIAEKIIADDEWNDVKVTRYGNGNAVIENERTGQKVKITPSDTKESLSRKIEDSYKATEEYKTGKDDIKGNYIKKLNDISKREYENKIDKTEYDKEIRKATEDYKNKKAYNDYVKKTLNNDEYLQANRPNEYFLKQMGENGVKTFADEIKERNKKILSQKELSNMSWEEVIEKNTEFYNKSSIYDFEGVKQGKYKYEEGWRDNRASGVIKQSDLDKLISKKDWQKAQNDISPMSEYSDTTGTGLSDKQHSTLSKMSFSEMQNLAKDYNIDTKGLSKKQLMAKIIAIFNK